MEPVPVEPWAQADILRKQQALQSRPVARQHQMALTLTMTMLKSLLPVFPPHVTSYASVSSSPLLLTASSCSVVSCLQPGVADCRQKVVSTVHAGCKLIDARFDALVI